MVRTGAYYIRGVYSEKCLIPISYTRLMQYFREPYTCKIWRSFIYLKTIPHPDLEVVGSNDSKIRELRNNMILRWHILVSFHDYTVQL